MGFICIFLDFPRFLVPLIFLTRDYLFIAGSAGALVSGNLCSKVPLVRPRGLDRVAWTGPCVCPHVPRVQVCLGP